MCIVPLLLARHRSAGPGRHSPSRVSVYLEGQSVNTQFSSNIVRTEMRGCTVRERVGQDWGFLEGFQRSVLGPLCVADFVRRSWFRSCPWSAVPICSSRSSSASSQMHGRNLWMCAGTHRCALVRGSYFEQLLLNCTLAVFPPTSFFDPVICSHPRPYLLAQGVLKALYKRTWQS